MTRSCLQIAQCLASGTRRGSHHWDGRVRSEGLLAAAQAVQVVGKFGRFA